jgi:hypothetical protein
MKRRILIYLALTLILAPGCAGNLYSRPPGERIGSCSGKIRPEGRLSRRFTVEVYRTGDDAMTAYFTMRRSGIHRARITDIEMDDGAVEIDLAGRHRSVEGEILMDDLAIEGTLEPWFGHFRFELGE